MISYDDDDDDVYIPIPKSFLIYVTHFHTHRSTVCVIQVHHMLNDRFDSNLHSHVL